MTTDNPKAKIPPASLLTKNQPTKSKPNKPKPKGPPDKMKHVIDHTILIVDEIPYRFYEGGFQWTLIAVHNDFTRVRSLVSTEYENQYGHIKTRFDF